MKLIKTPRAVDIEITNRCNLRCSYCSHFSSASDVDRELSLEEWISFIEELSRCAVMSITLSGGEPFLRDDLFDIIDIIAHNRIRFTILSNGTLITDDVARFLASTNRCDTVQVSIDGSIPTTHDSFRGVGNFKRAVEGIKHLQRHGVPVSVRVTIHKKNVMEIENIARFLLEEMNIPSFSTNSASYMGICRRNAEEVQLNPEERLLAMETLLRLRRRYRGRINAAAGPLAEGERWLMMERARKEDKDGILGGGYLRGCGGVMTKLAVRADGVMVPCGLLAHIELGRINKDSLIEVWQDHPELSRMRQRRNVPLSSFSFCQGCEYIRYCTGNCPALAFTIAGDDFHPSPDACLRRFLEEGGRLPDEVIINPGE